MDKIDSDRSPNPSSDAKKRKREFQIHELLGDAKEATLIHAGERYRLRITSNNKLILTK